MELFGALRSHLRQFGANSSNLDSFGSILELFRAIERNVEPFKTFRAIWSYLGPFGAF